MPIPPVTKFSMPAVRVGVGAVVRRKGDPSILMGERRGSHGAG
jgi:ADP-ribose pyrophosphatase YjhB (NUDIX family)